MDVGQAESLLIKAKWHQEQLLHNYLDNTATLREQAGLPATEGQAQSKTSGKYTRRYDISITPFICCSQYLY